jgi:1-pyrroline-5-carboxylate dehydrogenase
MDAITLPPAPINEPNLTYAPQSPERAALKAELARLESKQHTLRAHINGKKRNGGGEEMKVVQPHDHQHVLGTFKNSTTKDAEAAVKAAAAAAPDWRAMSFDDRAAISGSTRPRCSASRRRPTRRRSTRRAS